MDNKHFYNKVPLYIVKAHEQPPLVHSCHGAAVTHKANTANEKFLLYKEIS